MKITHDKDADAMYIQFREGKFNNNKKINDFLIVDYDKEGKLLGIELLEVSKNMPKESLMQVNGINLTA